MKQLLILYSWKFVFSNTNYQENFRTFAPSKQIV